MVGRGGRKENLMELGLIGFVLDMFGKLHGLWKWLRTRRFRQVFGEDSNKKFYVIYSVYRSPSRETIFPKPKPKVVRRCARGGTNLSMVNSCATTRAVGHLVYGFGENVKIAPIILSDKDTVYHLRWLGDRNKINPTTGDDGRDAAIWSYIYGHVTWRDMKMGKSVTADEFGINKYHRYRDNK